MSRRDRIDTPWSDEEIAQLRALHADGHGPAEIAAMLGRSRNAVIGKRHRLRLKPHLVPGWTPAEVATLRRLYTAGLGAPAIAKQLGRSRHSVDRKRRALGIRRAPPRRAGKITLPVLPSLADG